MPTELAAVAPQWFVYIVVIIAAFSFIGRALSEASETYAKLFGPLGKRWRERGLKRQVERTAQRETRQYEVEDRDQRIEYLNEQLLQCRDESEYQSEYILEDTKYHRMINIAAAEAHCELPPWKTYPRWLADKLAQT